MKSVVTTLQKIKGEWTVGYIGDDKVNHYLTHAPTLHELIHKLAEEIVRNQR